MEFGFTLTGLPADGILCFNRGRVGGLDVQGTERLRLVVDTFGRNSCRSQELPAVITDLYRLQTSNHRLYLVMSQKSGRLTVLGGIKTGKKKLFIRAETGSFCEIEPICVLDFYVHEEYQRQGLGKHLFEVRALDSHFLAEERQTAASVGYDRPSMKLLTFLRKHYGLTHYIPQSNNFVVFSAYFRNAGLMGPADSPWTSVSQRPLTAKKRQLQAAQQGHANRQHQGPGLASDSIAQRQLPGGVVHPNSLTAAGITSGRDGHMAASSIPAFRTAANSQLMQRSSQDRNHRVGCDSAGQTVEPGSRHVEPLSAQPQYQQRRSALPEQANLGGPQRGGDTFAQPRNAVQSTRHSAREGSSYEREVSGRAAGALHSVQHQACDPTHSEYPSVAPGSGVATQWQPEQQHAAATESDQLRLTAARDPIMTGQATASATAAQPVMYVKPPWAIDDPYQASRPSQTKHQMWGPPSAPPLSASASTWSLRAAAGKQRSGAGARDCLMW